MQKQIIPIMPPCKTYVEPFGGGASILIAREPVDLEVYNDLNHGLYTFFTVLSDPVKFDQFYRRVQPVLLSKQFYTECRDTWKDEPDDIIKAIKFFVAARQSFSGTMTGWSYSVRTKNKSAMSWMNTIDGLPQVHSRFRGVQVHSDDWSSIVDIYDSPETLLYCDPPYVQETRVDKEVYDHEMTADDHCIFVDKMLSINSTVVISGYAHPIYEPLEHAGWSRYDFEVSCNPSMNIGSVRNKRIETVWVKPYSTTRTKQKTFV